MGKTLTMKIGVVEERPGHFAAALVGCGNLLATCDGPGDRESARERCAELAAALRSAADAFAGGR